MGKTGSPPHPPPPRAGARAVEAAADGLHKGCYVTDPTDRRAASPPIRAWAPRCLVTTPDAGPSSSIVN